MSKQDRQGVRTAVDLERKYNLSQISNQASENARQDSQITQLSTSLSQFMGNTASAISGLNRRLSDIENESDPQSYGFLVTVRTDTLNTEFIIADKSFAEIEEAILDGQNVRIKLVCGSVEPILYLRLASHQEGIEANFCGYYNGIPIVLQLLADE